MKSKSKESKRQKTSHNDDATSKIKQPLIVDKFLTVGAEAGNDDTINVRITIKNEFQGCANSNKKKIILLTANHFHVLLSQCLKRVL